MIKKSSILAAGVAAAVLMSGCSSAHLPFLGDKAPDYKTAGAKVKPLEVPPDLNEPGADGRLTVPQGGETATWSAYSATRQQPAAPAAEAQGVLAPTSLATLARAGEHRYLVVQMAPEKVWPALVEFWQQQGFALKESSAQAGLIVTDWKERKDGAPSGFLSKLFANLNSSGVMDRYVTRIDRGAQPGTTEVYLTQQGMAEEAVGNTGQTAWKHTANDIGAETDMLSKIMAKFGVPQNTIKAEAAKPQGPAVRARLSSAGGHDVLYVDESFDQAWRRTSLALDRIGFTTEDRERGKGVFYVRYVDPDGNAASDGDSGGLLSKLAFWKSSKSAQKADRDEYRVQLSLTGDVTSVNVLDSQGREVHSATARRILNLLYGELK